MPVFGSGPKRTDGKTNPQINATPTYLLPTQVPNLSVWFDAADLSTVVTNISSLGQWWSKTNVSTVMSNAFGLPGPLWVSTAQNNLPVVRFRGDNNSLMSSIRGFNYPASNFTTNNEISMFLAYNPTNNGAPFNILNNTYGSDGNRIGPLCGQGFYFGNIYNTNGTLGGYSYALNTGFKIETYVGRQSTIFFKNSGGLFATSTFLTGLTAPTGGSYSVVMGGYQYGSRIFTQDIGEALIYNRGLSDGEISGIEAYLSKKWGIQNQLPFQHIGRPSQALMGYKFINYSNILAVTNVAAWYDAMYTQSITDIDGNAPPILAPNGSLKVNSWQDRSGNNNILTNTGSFQAAYNLFGCNYYPNINTINTGFIGLGKNPINNTYAGCNISLFAVISFGSPNTTYSVSFNDSIVNYNNNCVRFYRDNSALIAQNNYILSAPLSLNTQALVSILVNGSTTTVGQVLPSTNVINLNGTFVSSSTNFAGSNFNTSFVSLFSQLGSQLGNSPGVSISEVLFFYRTLTNPERTALESQLIKKWALPSNAPVSYINAGPNISTPYLWVDAYSSSNISTTVTSDGLTRVDTAFDRSGNGRNFTVVSGYSNIFYNRVSTMNSMNSLYFSTGSYNGQLSNIVPINAFSTNSYSFFMVYNQLSTNNATRLFGANNQIGSDVAVGGFSYQFVGQLAYFVPTTTYQSAGANINNGTNYLTSVIVNGGPNFDIYQTSTFNVYTNSGSGATYTSNINYASTNLLNISQFNIGGRINNLTYGFNGLISEVILYNRALSNAERQTIETYLLNKWNISNVISNVPVTNGLNLWLDAYDPSCVITDSNSNVLLWRDKSLCNFHFSNPNSNATTRSPVYTTLANNGLPSVLFQCDYSTYYTNLLNSNIYISTIYDLTTFVVCQIRNNPTNVGCIINCMSTASQVNYTVANGFYINNGANTVNITRSSISATITAVTKAPNLITVVYNSSFSTTVIADVPQNYVAGGKNGNIVVTNISSFISTIGNGALQILPFNIRFANLGNRGTLDYTQSYDGYTQEILIYNRTLSFIERQQVESYLLSKWKI